MENSVKDLPNQVEVQVHLHLVDHLEVFQNASGIRKLFGIRIISYNFFFYIFFLFFSSDIILEEPEAEEEDIMEEAAANVNCDIST